MKILAIETSCDETAIAILEVKDGEKQPVFSILSSVVSSQVKLHAKWGGVVPSLAKREHIKNLPVVLNKALKQARLLNSKPDIDLIAVVNGPGLEPALWTAINFAKDLAEKWGIPLMPINHMEGHLFSVFLKQKKDLMLHASSFMFPAIALLVSGGHTEIVLIKDWLKYKTIGETRDDAAGEAFDKVARMLDLGYPGGPAISREAAKWKFQNPNIELPRPMMHSKDYDFSFSGLKTAVLYKVQELKKENASSFKLHIPSICAEFQQAVIDVLISKTLKAAKDFKAKTIILAGGVSANKELRKQLKNQQLITSNEIQLLLPSLKFTGDNAAMMALTAYFRYKSGKFSKSKNIKAQGNLKLK